MINPTNIMLDLESLGTDSNSVITQIAMVAFDSITFEIKAELSVSPNVVEQILSGRTISNDTIDFWNDQNENVIDRVMYSPTTRRDVTLATIADFLLINVESEDSELYANGVLFDVTALDSYFNDYSSTITNFSGYFGYNKVLDYRSIRQFVKKKLPENIWSKLETEASINNPAQHDALVDCYYQIDVLEKMSRLV